MAWHGLVQDSTLQYHNYSFVFYCIICYVKDMISYNIGDLGASQKP